MLLAGPQAPTRVHTVLLRRRLPTVRRRSTLNSGLRPGPASLTRVPRSKQPAGIISNLNAGVLMTLAWMAVVKRSGVSPLEGEWAQFLTIYAGLWLGASFMRPIRLSLALAAAPLVNAFLDATQRRLRINRACSFALLLSLIAAGSFAVIFGTIAAVGGFPNGVPPVRLPWAR